MKCTFRNKRISAILSVVPAEEQRFDEECVNYGLTEGKAQKLKKMMGLDRHRIAPPGVCSSDLCLHGLRKLLADGVLKKEDIGALLFISQTPDYRLPPTSNVLQGKLGLSHEVVCMDINQGCAGFLVGLMEAFLLLDILTLPKVVLLNGDTCSKQLDKRNRVSYPLVGDAGSVTVVERTATENPIFMSLKMDGSRYQALLVPGGGYRMPSSPETLASHEAEPGVVRNLEQVHMDGAAIFNFTLEDVPPQIEEILSFSGNTRDSIDVFTLHQPNEFIVKQLAAKMRIPNEKIASNIVGTYGNCSSVSIPLDLAHNYGERLERGVARVCLSGFGVGLTWGAMVMDLGPLAVCRTVSYQPE